MIDDLANIIKNEDEACNGISISKFRELARKQYPFIRGGIYVDPKVVAVCTPNGRIFLNPDISTDTVARFETGDIKIDEKAAAWLTFLHEVAHLALGHICNDATCAEIASAEERRKQWTMEETAIYADIVLKHQEEADRWAVLEYKQLKKGGVINE